MLFRIQGKIFFYLIKCQSVTFQNIERNFIDYKVSKKMYHLQFKVLSAISLLGKQTNQQTLPLCYGSRLEKS